MYNPRHFQLDDLQLARTLITEAPLATVIGPDANGQAMVSHLPLGWGEDKGEDAEGWWLEGHMARANPHWQGLAEASEVTAVFSGPNGYVSPSLYDTKLAVPTWNYVAVHVHGPLTLIDDPHAKDHLLKRLIMRHDPPYVAQWLDLPEDYKQKMLGAIVGFRIQVARWEGKAKLSQNRAASERARLRAELSANGERSADMIAWLDRLGL